MKEYYESLENSIKEILEKRELIEKISNEVSKRIIDQGRIYIISAGAVSDIVNSFISSFDYLFKYNKEKIISISAGKAYKELYPLKWRHFENNKTIGALDAMEMGINEKDLILSLSSTGETDYVKNFLNESKSLGALTYSITASPQEQITEHNNLNITVNKTIQGLYIGNHTTILKAIIEGIMFNSFKNLGQIHNGMILTVDVWTDKLFYTSFEVLSKLSPGLTKEEAKKLLKSSDQQLSIAIIMLMKKISKEKALEELNKVNYDFRKITGIFLEQKK